ncbi:SDR family NAD(P)-dependent oxidoreductase [Motiliproteus sp. MSK22-1]|uniref:SDR family NAD(P)-dependent oxidoreductase n=1 Tax=Motiliproteus sp. MSK22-1 TaxID=1897630 RepID=UPI000976B6F3|nr:SDR family NAD(P)-dependent oxidoreductase [Motiliproteus sp. MSK22-1]OMH25817.1 short-chain dehydrogenase [Motiliproteus sp. MSK22-1]
MRLNNKLIVITGGTSGIGYQMVQYLHPDNRLIVISRNADKLNDLSRQFEGVVTFQADLSRLEEVEAVADLIVKRFESIDVLINNAAIQNTPTFLDNDFQYETISREITINFTSICSLTYLLLPTLLHRDKSVILNINSGLALAPKTTSAIYCATKGALNIFTQSLRYQLEQTNIGVQQVFLKLVDTTMTQGRGANKMTAEQAARQIIEGVARDIQDHDIGKVKLLRLLLRFAPSIARKIMKKY